MEVKAQLNYLRITSRKVRLVTDFIKGMEVKTAKDHLRFTPKRVSQPLLKLLNSAIANAENNFKLTKDALYIKEINVNEGIPLKRYRPVSRGRSFPIMKRKMKINLVLGVKEGLEGKKVKAERKPETQEIKKETEIAEKKEKTVTPRAPRKITKGSKIKGLTKKIFRRKSF